VKPVCIVAEGTGGKNDQLRANTGCGIALNVSETPEKRQRMKVSRFAIRLAKINRRKVNSDI